MDILTLYCEKIIIPIEGQIKKLRAKLYESNQTNKSLYEEYLEKYEKLLFVCYEKVSYMLEENE